MGEYYDENALMEMIILTAYHYFDNPAVMAYGWKV